MPRNETRDVHVTLDLDYAKLGNAIADALRLERERVRQGREDPIWETSPKPWTFTDATYADAAAAMLARESKARDRGLLVGESFRFRPRGDEPRWVLAEERNRADQRANHYRDQADRALNQLDNLKRRLDVARADLAAQYERLTGAGDPARAGGYWVAVQLLNDIINTPPTE